MVDKIEMSLDEIIKITKKAGGGRGGKGGFKRNGQKPVGRGGTRRGGGPPVGILKGRNRGGSIQKTKFNRSRGDVNSAWKHDLFDGPKRGGGGGGGAGAAGGFNKQLNLAKMLVSNLDYGVSENDIKELFCDCGPLKGASMHYDRSGRSLGTADVVFERRADAIKAMKQYNGVPLDGRPMNIQLATSELPTLRKVNPRIGTRPITNRSLNNRPGQRRGAAGPKRGGGVGNRLKTAKTAEELDAELDAYVNDMKI